ncbi:MAG TPA: NAD-dependent dehydratase, partial [Spirochaetia bacterium]|nr:NAD-dependent dehydratase [Spirochaetia bacterium]
RLRPEKSEVTRLLGDNKKIMKLTGWRQEFTLERGIRETIAWFREKENIKSYKAGIYSI